MAGMNRNLKGGYRLRQDGNFVSSSARNINCPYVAQCEKISRGGFLRTMGAGAAAIGAGMVGMSNVARAQEVTPPEFWDPNVTPVKFDRLDTTTYGNWFNSDEQGNFLGYNYGNCAYVLCAMNTENYRIENQVIYGDHRYDVYGG